ncbi:MAG TPA: Rieske (2Fe-2S) protein [Pseudonocardiaceae bacterium]|jgi:nitrite reductase/ring-hydroxylating ferredoxin subunit|nr:Rieske (2Fe-2S) protein [Pseudonocardiaceae bacterium]
MTAAHNVDRMTADLSEPDSMQVSRRQLMRTAAVAGTVLAAGAGLAACSSDSSSQSGSGPEVLGKTADIPVGGGVVYPNQHVVVTQPTAGTFKGFSSTCTHLGCTVNKVADGLIQCPCHGSKYSVADGSVKAGPAPKPLPAENISVKDSQIVLDS